MPSSSRCLRSAVRMACTTCGGMCVRIGTHRRRRAYVWAGGQGTGVHVAWVAAGWDAWGAAPYGARCVLGARTRRHPKRMAGENDYDVVSVPEGRPAGRR